jgi:6-phosphogluconolactonase
MSAEPEVVVSDTADVLAAEVARRGAEVIGAAIAERGTAHLAITGGGILEKALEALAQPEIDWRRVHVWWGDERYVPAASDDRNAKQARQALLDHVDVTPERVHEMPAADAEHADLTEAARAYGDELRHAGGYRFDVVMLGVGPDGHVASLFPGTTQLDVDDDIAVPVRDSPKPPPERISLTFPALNRTREVWFVASGAEKAEAVARATATGEHAADPHAVPAAGVHGEERTVWFLDEASASGLG